MTDSTYRYKTPQAQARRAVVICVAGLLMMSPAPFGAAADSPDGPPATRTVELTYAFTVRDLPEDADEVLAWIPLPRDEDHQTLHHYTIDAEKPPTRTEEDELGNRYLRFDLSEASRRGEDLVAISATYRVTRTAYRALDGGGTRKVSDEVARRFLSANQLIPLEGPISREARMVAGEATGTVRKARRLYAHIAETMTYDKSGEGWGRGDAMYACSVRKGNCTDFHSLFIGEARALDIPARFVMGLPLPPDESAGEIGGYHCWAQFHTPAHGWIPLDASEASKSPALREELFGGLDANRVCFTIGRDITIPGTSAGPQNYVIYPHVEVDGSTWDKVKTDLSYRDVRREARAGK